MKLYEYQCKRLFAECDIPVPKGKIAFTLNEVRDIARGLGEQVAIKSQILTGERAKEGGVLLAENAEEAQLCAEAMLGREIKGLPVQKVLVEEVVEAKHAFYLAVTIDYIQCKPLLLASREGGEKIEAVAKSNPEAVLRLHIDPLGGLLNFQARNLALELGLRRKSIDAFVKIAKGLYQVFTRHDARLVEINPLILTLNDQFLAVDAKIDLDDNALFRHPDLADKRVFQEGNNAERLAYQAGLSYIKLDGDIGCLVNGGGLAMATIDIVRHYGGNPANFLDIGGGANAYKVSAALRILLSDPDVKVILFNIFGGITRCDEVAIGILDALQEIQTDILMVARLAGTNGEAGRAILSQAHFPCTKTFGEAARAAIAIAKGATLSWAS